jgi:hypothetical protein
LCSRTGDRENIFSLITDLYGIKRKKEIRKRNGTRRIKELNHATGRQGGTGGTGILLQVERSDIKSGGWNQYKSRSSTTRENPRNDDGDQPITIFPSSFLVFFTLTSFHFFPFFPYE